MTKQNQNQMILSAFVGFIVTIALAIVADHSYGHGENAWVQWFVDNGTHFFGGAIITYGVLYIWQAIGNSLWDIRSSLKKFSHDMSD